MNFKRPNPAKLQQKVDAFNSQFSIGETVNVKNDDGSIVRDIIRHPATIMGGHTAMAWLESKGSYILERVSKII